MTVSHSLPWLIVFANPGYVPCFAGLEMSPRLSF